VRDHWDAETLRNVRDLASDVSSLMAFLEASRRRHADDETIQRSYAVAARMQHSLERLIALLRT
jgi:hypothetical protein